MDTEALEKEIARAADGSCRAATALEGILAGQPDLIVVKLDAIAIAVREVRDVLQTIADNQARAPE